MHIIPEFLKCPQCLKVLICDIWFGGLIDGYSALGVVYEVSLEVVLRTHA